MIPEEKRRGDREERWWMGRPSLKWCRVCTSTVGLLCMPHIVTIKADRNPYVVCCALEERIAWRIPSCDMTYLDKYKEGMHGEPQEYPFGGTIFKVVCWEEVLRLAEGLSLMKVLLIYWSEFLKSNSYGVVSFLRRFWCLYVYRAVVLLCWEKVLVCISDWSWTLDPSFHFLPPPAPTT